uniref:Uncharacterized protein n=1 Tax=Setaria digitata TaxID=48799 RepID=A0A915PXL5_9BILA
MHATTDAAYEWELRRLKKLQLIRVKQFKESMLDRLKRQKSRGKHLKKTHSTTEDEDKLEEKIEESLSVTGEQSVKSFRNRKSDELSRENVDDTALRQFEMLAKMNDNKTKVDEKVNDGIFVFDMQANVHYEIELYQNIQVPQQRIILKGTMKEALDVREFHCQGMQMLTIST